MLNQVISSQFIESFTVSQERGQSSTVQVFEELYKNYPRDTKALRFVSDQSLASQSSRAWNVEKAIENYARPKGYDANDKSGKRKNEWLVFYDAYFHSHMEEFRLREAVKNSPAYKVKVADNTTAADTINREYGIAIRQLKNLVTALEKRNQEELDRLNQELIAVQKDVLNRLEISEFLNEQDKKFLFDPNYPIDQVKIDSYNNYGQGYVPQSNAKFPTDLNSIMCLLD